MDLESVVPRSMAFHLLEKITDGFSEQRKLGSGYIKKGLYEDGKKIAVKMLYPMPGLDDEQFEKEYHNPASLHHKNIVQLVGYCHETRREYLPYNGKMVLAEMTQRALCFEFMQNGSLDSCISDESNGHDWHTRYSIIKGICHGLKYLHVELKPPIFHLDLKPANILLDENMVPKIADFGLSRLLGEEQTQITNSSLGTRGYLPPEYIERNVISNKFYIFSLGVVIIKLMTGPTGYSKCAEMSSQEFIEQVQRNWRDRLLATSVYASEPYYEENEDIH
ncbi:cysteine-rich receptor-like protein kinase 26 [Triticum urartu]|uniref:non-specific serine/threonine protein kinase n=1 Tax=Triticum urartu TaxID=4572 RepID=A0A8R7TBT8_TRIUA|nr:cysteine-rich receptor-like protein kinase 26 [Triticum urartu]XP_048554085.1 cysteine-rich receptor-like protein kinase 26 [Triticum urartu]